MASCVREVRGDGQASALTRKQIDRFETELSIRSAPDDEDPDPLAAVILTMVVEHPDRHLSPRSDPPKLIGRSSDILKH